MNIRSKSCFARQKARLRAAIVGVVLMVCIQRAQGSIFKALRSAHLLLHDCKVAFFLGAHRLFSSSLHTCTLRVCVNLTVLKWEERHSGGSVTLIKRHGAISPSRFPSLPLSSPPQQTAACVDRVKSFVFSLTEQPLQFAEY